MYEKGIGTGKDVAKAVQLYRSAAEHGYAEAQNLMGILYSTGSNGVTEDDKQALDWFQKAAGQGFAKAEKNLGDMYFFGHGIDKDYAQALTWYGKAADQQFADAQARLGYMYEKGLGRRSEQPERHRPIHQGRPQRQRRSATRARPARLCQITDLRIRA